MGSGWQWTTAALALEHDIEVLARPHLILCPQPFLVKPWVQPASANPSSLPGGGTGLWWEGEGEGWVSPLPSLLPEGGSQDRDLLPLTCAGRPLRAPFSLFSAAPAPSTLSQLPHTPHGLTQKQIVRAAFQEAGVQVLGPRSLSPWGAVLGHVSPSGCSAAAAWWRCWHRERQAAPFTHFIFS